MIASAIQQIVPYPEGEDVAAIHYARDAADLQASLTGRCEGQLLEVFPPSMHNPYPMGITLPSFNLMKEASSVLHRSIQVIVANYFKDPRLCEHALVLSERARQVLRKAEQQPYRVGSWRPDVLFPSDDPIGFRICGEYKLIILLS